MELCTVEKIENFLLSANDHAIRIIVQAFFMSFFYSKSRKNYTYKTNLCGELAKKSKYETLFFWLRASLYFYFHQMNF